MQHFLCKGSIKSRGCEIHRHPKGDMLHNGDVCVLHHAQQALLQAALHRASAADKHCPAKIAFQHPVQPAAVSRQETAEVRAYCSMTPPAYWSKSAD